MPAGYRRKQWWRYKSRPQRRNIDISRAKSSAIPVSPAIAPRRILQEQPRARARQPRSRFEALCTRNKPVLLRQKLHVTR